MRRCLLRTWGGVWLTLLLPGALAFAAQPAGREERIRDAVSRVERAGSSLSEAAGSERLAVAFHVPTRIVSDLRDQKLTLGETAVVLALAEVGKSSPDAILSLWASGRLNWGEIAERLKVDLRGLLRRLDGVRRDLARRKG